MRVNNIGTSLLIYCLLGYLQLCHHIVEGIKTIRLSDKQLSPRSYEDASNNLGVGYRRMGLDEDNDEIFHKPLPAITIDYQHNENK